MLKNAYNTWHDLRDNPKDIPECRPFMYAFKSKDYPNKLFYDVAIGYQHDVDVLVKNNSEMFEYVAWSYIDLFKEENK